MHTLWRLHGLDIQPISTSRILSQSSNLLVVDLPIVHSVPNRSYTYDANLGWFHTNRKLDSEIVFWHFSIRKNGTRKIFNSTRAGNSKNGKVNSIFFLQTRKTLPFFEFPQTRFLESIFAFTKYKCFQSSHPSPQTTHRNPLQSAIDKSIQHATTSQANESTIEH